ncbi:MAG: hypothetical protein H3C62_12110 [Gemmatimonadaceae bacterium]|nr:hypothetical protein [Gemmatimonadaceae bacterium]
MAFVGAFALFAAAFLIGTASGAGLGGVVALAAGVAASVTAPMAGGPGGAAMSSTLYIGGSATDDPAREATTSAPATTTCRNADATSGIVRPRGRACACITAGRTPAR